MKSKLVKAREKSGLSKPEVYGKLGVSQPTYDGYELDPSKMQVGKAIRLCKILNADFAEIFLSEH